MALISPPDSPDFSHTSGESKNGLDHEKVQIYSKDEIQSPEAMVKGNFVDAWVSVPFFAPSLFLSQTFHIPQKDN